MFVLCCMLSCIKENARLVIKKASLTQKKGHMHIYIYLFIYISYKDTREEGICEGETKNIPLSQILSPSISDSSCWTGECSSLSGNGSLCWSHKATVICLAIISELIWAWFYVSIALSYFIFPHILLSFKWFPTFIFIFVDFSSPGEAGALGGRIVLAENKVIFHWTLRGSHITHRLQLPG